MQGRSLFEPHVPELVEIESRGLTLEEQWLEFHKKNPHVYQAIEQVARAMLNAGWRRAGIGQIFERLRWLHAMRTQGSRYKLNNNYRAFYARLLMDDYPEFAGFFETRVQKCTS